MSEPFKHTLYSAADIKRYHNGSMDSRERHALEKAALDDPFLADALEGYTNTTTPQQDLSKLKKRLNDKTTRETVSPFLVRPLAWLKAAAILLMVAGGGWLVYTMRSPQTGIANTTNRTAAPKISTNTVDTNQSITYNNDTPVSNDSDDSQSTSVNPSRTSLQQTLTKTPGVASRRVVKVTPAPARNKEERTYDKAEIAAAKQEAEIAPTTPLSYPATAKQSFVAATADSTAVVSANQSSPDTVKLDIVLKEDKASLSEVVVVNKGLKRKTEVKPTVSVEESEPANGWKSFSDYIAERLKEPGLKETYSGEVELSFEVNKKGEPVNIVVTKSQCNQCDEEAIRLLKEGPKWKKKARRGKVTIHF